MRGVDAELVRPPGAWEKCHAGAANAPLEDLPVGHGLPAMDEVDELPRALVQVHAQWQ